MIRKLLIWALFAILPFSIGTTDFSVLYDCSGLPSEATPPWDIVGRCNYQLVPGSGMLLMMDPDQCSWALLERPDSWVGEAAHVTLEARVMVPSGSGETASPQIAFTGLDPALPYDNRAHVWYAVDLYPNGIGFTKVDNDKPEGKDFGFCSIPDFSTAYHTTTLRKHEESGVRDFVVLVDGSAVITVTNEIDPRPITAMDVGHGLEIGVGYSLWDYVRYWSESPIGIQSAT